MAGKAAEVGHFEPGGDRDPASSLDGEHFTWAVAVGGENPHFAAETGKIEAQPVERFRSATICAGGLEVRADVENLQDLMPANDSSRMALPQPLFLL